MKLGYQLTFLVATCAGTGLGLAHGLWTGSNEIRAAEHEVDRQDALAEVHHRAEIRLSQFLTLADLVLASDIGYVSHAARELGTGLQQDLRTLSRAEGLGARREALVQAQEGTALILSGLSIADEYWEDDRMDVMNTQLSVLDEQSMNMVDVVSDLIPVLRARTISAQTTLEETKVAVYEDGLKKAGIFAVVIGIAWLWCLLWIVRPVRRATAAMKEISEGDADLTQRLGIHRRDEIGQLCISFDTFAARLQEIVGQVQNETLDLAVAAQNLSCAAIELRGMATEVSEEMYEIEVHERANAQTIAEAAEQIAVTTEEGREMLDTVSVVASQASDSLSALEDASQLVDQFAVQGAQMSGVAEMISSIALETNLLSMNASVEAVNAGAAGKGFAVVAEEVRRLAGDSAESTEQIQKILESFDERSVNARSSLEAVVGTVRSVTRSQAEVAGTMEQQTTANDVACRGIQEIVQDITRLAERTTVVSEKAKVGRGQASHAEELCRELAGMSERLGNMLSRFRA